MPEIIDLSQEIFEGMPVYKSLPQVKMSVHNTHEEWDNIKKPTTETPAVYKLEMCEHTGTHVDALNHMAAEYKDESIDTMPLSMFYTEGICLDFSHKKLQELITTKEVKSALLKSNQTINKGDTVLLYTDHYRKYFNTDNWGKGPGITAECASWLGEQKIAAFGVETMSPGVPKISNKEVHHICGELKFTHYENMINLYKLINRGRFRFIGLPLKIRGGTGSPVRAVAIFE
ncbi:cyclase family protein [Tenacibaculum sp. AHE15PA]|uniref:cyclase family protein n=1 Tax=unclassified Tenacibaculum TaxID=2635139 RepID=UPI001C4E3691|nr:MULTISPECIES: cyclase family protein [unclassified Tenacibaculum]QXP74046.1 cyclase family protein [Tenacibaculum sp. AHE14PA]QXP75586.1 cyclase family protein [Tenacibaculum sp. AHE15PA]